MGTLLALSPFAHAQATQFGAVNIASSSVANNVTLTFNTPATLANISVVTQGVAGLDFADAATGTCATGTSYIVGATCTVTVTFTPKASGVRYGAVVLSDGAANVIATSYLQGTGTGPQATFLPGTETVSTSSVNGPGTIAVDGSGNLFIADINNNRIVKETLSGGSYTESTVVTSAMNTPYAVSLDGAGNLYITDTGNNRILKETLAAGIYTESIVATSALNYPTDIAVDGSGNIYIADIFNNRVVVETITSSGNSESTLPTSALNEPGAIAVDGLGNVFIADSANNRVLEETLSAGSYTETVMPTSTLSYPGAVRVDGSSNVYIADTFNQRVIKEKLSAGSYTESTLATSTLNYPYGLAVDQGGNVYIADSFNNRILKEDIADPSSLSFASTIQGSTSTDSPKTVSVYNYGNATLSFSAVSFPADFPEAIPALGDCTASTTLSTTGSCTLTIKFTPVAVMSSTTPVQLTEGVNITTNTLSVPATQQTVTVTGTEIHP